MNTLVCIPAFNEEGAIGKLVRKTLSYVDSVVVCDDGSSDNTAKEAENSGAHVIVHDENRGKGSALKSLFEHARHSSADIIVTIDGDGQFLPEEIKKLTKPIIEKTSDIVVGYRFDNDTEMPSYRKIGNKILDHATNIATSIPIRDTQSGFRAYSKNAIELIEFSNDGFTADSEILIDASKHGLRISEEKITVIYDTGRRTSTKNPILHGSSVLGSLIEMILVKHPLKYLGIPGLIVIFCGVLLSSYTISVFNQTALLPIPFALVSIGLLLLGFLLLMTSGILFAINRSIFHK
ncbi:MAG: glycosyltransferase family 2 protein [Nitrosopumilus sp.]|nr:glycosyltransferase family 2 protein [Nitrosopumilus sp.]|tara:strand:+ start:97 stop:975 length:879 start_codon:yes stop_codon:yes gene_type:complete